MTGGPNSRKHPIDYEYSTYDRSDLIFRFSNVDPDQVANLTGQNKLKVGGK